MKTIKLDNRIKEHRGRLDITQQKLAKVLGISRVTIGKIENGADLKTSTALKLAEAFECSIHEIFKIKYNDRN